MMCFLLGVHHGQHWQLSALHHPTLLSWPGKPHRLQYKAKQSYVIYQIPVQCGSCKRPVPRGATYGKPFPHGLNQLKVCSKPQLATEERAGCPCGAPRVLNSYWVGRDSTYKFFEVILLDPIHKAIRGNPDTQWITEPVCPHGEKWRLTRAGHKSGGLGKVHKFCHSIGGPRCRHGEDAVPSAPPLLLLQ